MTDLPRRDSAVCWHPYTQHGIEPDPLAVLRGSGAWLDFADGSRRLDAISSWWTCLHGHSHPRLVQALRHQAETLDHVLFAGCTHEPAVSLAERLIAACDDSNSTRPLRRVFYSDDGSTAVEVALKAAYQSQRRRGQAHRTAFLALEGAYHGDTFGAMAAGDPDPFFVEFAPLLCDVRRVAPTVEALEDAFRESGEQSAALIMEPLVQGAAGMVMHGPELLRAARRLCDDYGVMWIADEVMTGFGRTGSLFACCQAQVWPDLLCLAKGLTGGMLPLAATLATEDIYESFVSDSRAQAFFHGHSFTAHALGCAVALASLDLLEEEQTPTKLNAIGTAIEARLADLRDAPAVRELRRTGGIVAVELEAATSGYLAGLGETLRRECRAQPDVLLRPLGNILYAIPPSCTTLDEAAIIADAIRRIVENLE